MEQARSELLAAVGGPPGRPQREPQFPPATVTPRLPGTLPTVWNLPPRNPGFTGRDAVLAVVRQRLQTGQWTLVQALHGMGGWARPSL